MDDRKKQEEPLLGKYGGYRGLKSFQMAQLAYDVTVLFCQRYLDKRSRTNGQMVQAARSGVQNIAEGSQASVTSKKTELKLTGVARASLEELTLDYEDYLRQHGLAFWPRERPALAELRKRRPQDPGGVQSLGERRTTAPRSCGKTRRDWTDWTDWTH